MTRDCLMTLRILKPVVLIHIWRISCDNIKRSPTKQSGSFLYITMHNIDICLNPIQFHTSTGHVNINILYLQSRKMQSGNLIIACFHQNRYDSVSASEIKNLIVLPHCGKRT